MQETLVDILTIQRQTAEILTWLYEMLQEIQGQLEADQPEPPRAARKPREKARRTMH